MYLFDAVLAMVTNRMDVGYEKYRIFMTGSEVVIFKYAEPSHNIDEEFTFKISEVKQAVHKFIELTGLDVKLEVKDVK